MLSQTEHRYLADPLSPDASPTEIARHIADLKVWDVVLGLEDVSAERIAGYADVAAALGEQLVCESSGLLQRPRSWRLRSPLTSARIRQLVALYRVAVARTAVEVAA